MEVATEVERGSGLRAVGAVAVAAGTILTILAIVVLLFFNPAWVGFEQERSGVDRLTGYPMADVHRVTDAMISEVYFGPGTFDEQVGGVAVLDSREQSHMADVRTVVLRFLAAAALGLVVLITAAVVGRRSAWFWRGVAAGSATLLVVGAIVGIGVTVAFDAAFELFHELFFPPGSFDFDPRTERLVQIFPEQLFDETGLAVAVVGLGVAVIVLVVAVRRVRGVTR